MRNTDVIEKEKIRRRAREIGLDAIGFCSAEGEERWQEGLQTFIAANYHGDMDWMERRMPERASPQSLWPQARSIIVAGHNYGSSDNPLEKLQHKNHGLISCYAQGEDYHEVMKKKLKELTHWLIKEYGGDAKVFVDTAPVMERPLAEKAGIGWRGKHSCVVSREFGSWLFLGEIFTTLDIEPDKAQTDHCGTCNACISICPTQAFTKDRQLDARRCISYLTIEHKGHIPLEFRNAIGNRIYGCDDCLAVCPWNKFAQESREVAYHARAELNMPSLETLLALDDAAFRTLFRKSPIKRTGRNRFIRNALIAAGNSGNTNLLPHIAPLLRDESPLVRAMAVWAYGKLADADEQITIKKSFYENERDENVKEEWNRHG